MVTAMMGSWGWFGVLMLGAADVALWGAIGGLATMAVMGIALTVGLRRQRRQESWARTIEEFRARWGEAEAEWNFGSSHLDGNYRHCDAGMGDDR